jgi:glycosyltransferase involved in cell wall biosynthesis
MEHISQLQAQIQEQTACPDILVVSRFFLPKQDGIGEYIYNRCLQDPERVIVLAAGCLGDKIFDKAQNFPVYRWPIPRSWKSNFLATNLKSLLSMVFSFAMAIKLYFRYRYRYIEWGHGYEFPALLLLSYILPIRFFIYLHGNDILAALRNPLMRSLFSLTLKRAVGIVCNSSFTQEYLMANFRFNTPTYVINPAVRAEKFGVGTTVPNVEELRRLVRQCYNIPESAIVILSIGPLVKHKGFDRVIDNLTLLLTLGVDVHYILCGGGSCELELKSLVRRLRIDRRVHFAGYVPETELGGYYAACDLFAMLPIFDPKVPYIESFGIVYLEAAYFGKPVIASRLGSITDAVRDQENGILVNPNSGYEIFQAFSQLCQDKQLRERLGRRGKELANRKTFHRTLYFEE